MSRNLLGNLYYVVVGDYKQGVEKWDTDSDTDASDDEADLAV